MRGEGDGNTVWLGLDEEEEGSGVGGVMSWGVPAGTVMIRCGRKDRLGCRMVFWRLLDEDCVMGRFCGYVCC